MNCQKIELYGSPTAKELKKMGSQSREDVWQGGRWWTRWSHICVHIKQEEKLGSEIDHATQASTSGKRKHQNFWL